MDTKSCLEYFFNLGGDSKLMGVRIRLARMGAKKKPFYRIVVADARSPRDGRFIEIVGTYDPKEEPAVVTLKDDRVIDWLSKGAIPTLTVSQLLKKRGIAAKPKEIKAS